MSAEEIENLKAYTIHSGNLDPIRVIFQDIAHKQGLVIIQCFDKAWCAGWGSMEGDYKTVKDFFIDKKTYYLVRNFSSNLTEIDYEAINKKLLENGINDDLSGGFLEFHGESELWANSEVMSSIYGEAWHHFLPETETQEAKWLTEIIEAIKSEI